MGDTIRIVFFTIVLNGMPYIKHHYPEFLKLSGPWEWCVIEGVAAPMHCTSWCKRIPPGLSSDGTTEYLYGLLGDLRVHQLRKEIWRGKAKMINAALGHLIEPCLLWQVDCDECWTASQIETVRDMFERVTSRNCARFLCRYYVGPGLIITSRNTYGNYSGEWLRVWRFDPGMTFDRHEPPELSGAKWKAFTREETEKLGLVFDHYAYHNEAQLAFKERYYGYDGAVDCWKRLQSATKFPLKLRDYFHWVKDDAIVDRI